MLNIDKKTCKACCVCIEFSVQIQQTETLCDVGGRD